MNGSISLIITFIIKRSINTYNVLASILLIVVTRVKQWEAYWRYVMSVVDLAVVPTGRGSSPAEEPGSSLDVASRTDTEQGNRASASAEAASAIHPARAAQDTQQHTATAGSVPASVGTNARAATTKTVPSHSSTGSPPATVPHTPTRTPAPATPPRRINRYLRAQLVEEMVALHQAGQMVAQIASRFGFHRTTVARHLKQAGETLRTDPADPAFQERVLQAYAEIGTVKHTAQKLSVSKDTVRKVVRGE